MLNAFLDSNVTQLFNYYMLLKNESFVMSKNEWQFISQLENPIKGLGLGGKVERLTVSVAGSSTRFKTRRSSIIFHVCLNGIFLPIYWFGTKYLYASAFERGLYHVLFSLRNKIIACDLDSVLYRLLETNRDLRTIMTIDFISPG